MIETLERKKKLENGYRDHLQDLKQKIQKTTLADTNVTISSYANNAQL